MHRAAKIKNVNIYYELLTDVSQHHNPIHKSTIMQTSEATTELLSYPQERGSYFVTLRLNRMLKICKISCGYCDVRLL